MNSKTKKLAQTALLLAICLLSQYFKNLSVYITGPVINACLILCALTAGLPWAAILCVVTPITAFFIAGSPIMAGIPLMFPAIMAGNFILTFFAWFFEKKTRLRFRLPIGLMAGSVLKGLFMGLVIVGVLLPVFGNNIASHLPKPEALNGVLAAARTTFSVTQLITALIGSLLAWIIWTPLKKYLKNEG